MWKLEGKEGEKKKTKTGEGNDASVWDIFITIMLCMTCIACMKHVNMHDATAFKYDNYPLYSYDTVWWRNW